MHRRKRAVPQELFKRLLHKLVTGEVRMRELRLELITAAVVLP